MGFHLIRAVTLFSVCACLTGSHSFSSPVADVLVKVEFTDTVGRSQLAENHVGVRSNVHTFSKWTRPPQLNTEFEHLSILKAKTQLGGDPWWPLGLDKRPRTSTVQHLNSYRCGFMWCM